MKNLFKINAFIICVFIFSLSVIAQSDSPLVILKKPRPTLTREQSKRPPHMQGSIILRVTFLADATIGEIKPVVELPMGLTENAIEAAKLIKFTPQIKNGNPVNLTRQIQYIYEYGAFTNSLPDERAEEIIKKAVEKLGGAKYLQVKTIVSSGNYTLFRGGTADLPSSFIDVVLFPAKERTEFKQQGNKTVQTNSGENGWIFDAGTQTLRDQNPAEIANFKQSRRTSLDNILRGAWRLENAKLSYVGKRAATLGKRNEVVKLVYSDGFTVEYEFDGTDGMPMKAVFDGKDENGAAKEEERYAQFVDVQGVSVPFIVDRWAGGKQVSRINYSKIEINKNVSDSIFTKPADAKSLKKDLKL